MTVDNINGKNQAGGIQQLSKNNKGEWICPKCGQPSKHLAKMSSIDDLGCMSCWSAYKGHPVIATRVASKLIAGGATKDSLEKSKQLIEDKLEEIKND